MRSEGSKALLPNQSTLQEIWVVEQLVDIEKGSTIKGTNVIATDRTQVKTLVPWLWRRERSRGLVEVANVRALDLQSLLSSARFEQSLLSLISVRRHNVQIQVRLKTASGRASFFGETVY